MEKTDQADRPDRIVVADGPENRPLPRKEKEKIRPAYLWFLAGACGVFIALFVMAVQWKEARKVVRVEVRGAEIFSEKAVKTRAKVPAGTPIDSLSLTAVRDRLVSHPYIRAARVSRSYPDAVLIELEERVPVASFTSKGAVKYVDAEGVVLPNIESEVTHDLPTITGVEELAATAPGTRVEGDAYFEALGILWAAMETDTAVYHLISEVDMREPDDVTLYSTEGAVPIRFGRGDAPRKMALLRAFWDRFVRDEGPENLEYLDLRFGDRVVAKWAKKSKESINLSSM